MSSGYAAYYADVIEEDCLANLCPEAWQEFQNILGKYGVLIEDFAQVCASAYGYDDLELAEEWVGHEKEACQQIENAWKSLQQAFAQTTTVGTSHLDLDIGYHDSENQGGGYDDIDGMYFIAEGVYDFTPAGSRFKDHIRRKYFVVFG
jgi:hypothetical protein